jgi:uncharacterized membrane protein required for colicin V production
MTIWILALLLLATLALVGYSQGAIRVGISLVGILFAIMLCVPLGGIVKPALRALGAVNPVLIWVLAPFIVFCVINIAFKLIALSVHRKVDLHYRYDAGDLRLSLWERMNKRLGACLGLVNGLVYLVLIAFVIHAFSYWTSQMSAGPADSAMVKFLNRMGHDLQSTKLDRAAAAVGKLSPSYYEAADLAGLLFHHPLLEARLSRYPGLLSIGERPELQALGSDKDFADLRLRQASLSEVRANPSVDAILKNPELMNSIWVTVSPDLVDLDSYLRTLKSQKYGKEEILGRWSFDLGSSMLAYRRDKPGLSVNDVPKIRRWMDERFVGMSFVAAPDKMAALKNFPLPATPSNPNPGNRTLQGKWRYDAGDYFLTIPGEEERKLRINQGKLSFKTEGISVVLIPEI